MLTQKKLTSELPTGELGKNVVKWVAQNSKELSAKFEKQYPRSRNQFNIQVLNTNGVRRTLVLTGEGQLKFDKHNSYKNVLQWKTLRKLGCPEA